MVQKTKRDEYSAESGRNRFDLVRVNSPILEAPVFALLYPSEKVNLKTIVEDRTAEIIRAYETEHKRAEYNLAQLKMGAENPRYKEELTT